MLEVFPVQVLHHQVGFAGVRGAEVHDVDQVRVAKARGHLGFAAKTCEGFRIRGQLARHHLDGDPLVQAELEGLVDSSHTAFTDEARDLICPSQHGAGESTGLGILRHASQLQTYVLHRPSQAKIVSCSTGARSAPSGNHNAFSSRSIACDRGCSRCRRPFPKRQKSQPARPRITMEQRRVNRAC